MSIFFRLIINVLLFVSIINGWWFFAVTFVFLGFRFQSFYIEGLLAGIFFDSLFGMIPSLYLWGYIGTITAVIIWIFVRILKKITRR